MSGARAPGYYVTLAAQALLAPLRGIEPVVLPSQSPPLSDAEYAEAQAACDWIARGVERRGAYVAEHGLDPAIANPAANWSSDNSFYAGYRAVAPGARDALNHLRVFSQPFTGLLLGLLDNRGAEPVRTLPPDLDRTAAGLLDGRFTPWKLKLRALVSRIPELRGLGLPLAFGETGLLLPGGQVVNWDALVYLERMALLLRSGLIARLQGLERPVILEIGSGFGALANFIRRFVPGCAYICLDLPESLLFAAVYLQRFHAPCLRLEEGGSAGELTRHAASFVPNYMFHRLAESGLRVDLAINTLSMSEMSQAQVADYCRGLQALLGREGVFFEQNHDLRGIGLQDARLEIGRHFTHRVQAEAGIRLTQGAANIWAAAPEALRGLG